MRTIFYYTGLLSLCFFSCNNTSEKETSTEDSIAIADTLSTNQPLQEDTLAVNKTNLIGMWFSQDRFGFELNEKQNFLLHPYSADRLGHWVLNGHTLCFIYADDTIQVEIESITKDKLTLKSAHSNSPRLKLCYECTKAISLVFHKDSKLEIPSNNLDPGTLAGSIEYPDGTGYELKENFIFSYNMPDYSDDDNGKWDYDPVKKKLSLNSPTQRKEIFYVKKISLYRIELEGEDSEASLWYRSMGNNIQTSTIPIDDQLVPFKKPDLSYLEKADSTDKIKVELSLSGYFSVAFKKQFTSGIGDLNNVNLWIKAENDAGEEMIYPLEENMKLTFENNLQYMVYDNELTGNSIEGYYSLSGYKKKVLPPLTTGTWRLTIIAELKDLGILLHSKPVSLDVQ
jgi:hypothetical protein